MPAFLERVFEFLFKYRPAVFAKGDFTWAPPLPLLAVLALAALFLAPVVAAYARARGKTQARDRAILISLRIALVVVLLLCACRPLLVVATVVPQQSFLGVLLDDSKSLEIEDGGTETRAAVLQRVFGADAPLVRRLEERFKLRFFRFSTSPSRISGPADLSFEGATTDLAAALKGAREELAGVPLAGLVLVSDGADNGRSDMAATLLTLKAASVPVYSVGLGRERFTRDVEVSRVESPRAVLKGTTLAATVWLSERGYAGRNVTLVVEDEGRVVHTQQVTLPNEGESAAVRTFVTAADAGPRRFRFRVAPQDGEMVAQNNVQEALVQVDDRREKLLFYEGEVRFEPKFLRRAVADDKNLQVATLQRTATDKYLRLDVDDAEELAAGFPKTREELFRYRGLILGSIEASAFTTDQLRMIADFAGKRGGGLLMLGGGRAFSEGGYAGTPVADVLPVVLEPQPRQPAESFRSLRAELTPFGLSHAVAQIAATEKAAGERWRTLPALSAVNLVTRAKPGAATLVIGRGEGAGEPQVVLAYQRYGRGKSIAFTVQDSWLWQMHADIPLEDMTHESLWRQLLRWLVSGVPGPVTLETTQGRVPPGSPVPLRVEATDETYLAVNDAKVTAVVRTPTGERLETPLEWSIEKDGEYRGSFTPTQKGLYEVRVEARRRDSVLGQDAVSVDVGDLDFEFFGAEMRAPLLRRIAEETGGRSYGVEEVDRLPEDLSLGSPKGAAVLEQRDLWDMPALYLLALLLASAEWGLRRMRGLP